MKTTFALDTISHKSLLRLHHLHNGRRNGTERHTGGTNSMSATGSSPRDLVDEEFYCC